MKDIVFCVKENIKIAKNTYKMILCGDTEGIREGQFVNIKLDGFYLRRPISVCDVEGDALTIIYKVVGKGTQVMADMVGGEKLQTLIGLGNGYDRSLSGDKPLLIGGGAGVPPMYLLCKKLIAEGTDEGLTFKSYPMRYSTKKNLKLLAHKCSLQPLTVHTESVALLQTLWTRQITPIFTPVVPSLC